MAVKSTADLKIFIDANITQNNNNTNTGANHNTILNDIVDSFFSKLGTAAVTGSGTTDKITKWASTNVAAAGTWTQAVNDIIPDNNNAKIGDATFGVQMFGAAATTSTAPINLKDSVGVIPTGTNRKRGMLFVDGTSLMFHTADNSVASDLLASHPVIIANRIPKGNGTSVVDSTWEIVGNDIFPTIDSASGVDESQIGSATKRINQIYFGDFAPGKGRIHYSGVLNFLDLDDSDEERLQINTTDVTISPESTGAYDKIFAVEVDATNGGFSEISNVQIGGVSSTVLDMYIAHKNFFNTTDFALFQDVTTGVVTINGKTSLSGSIDGATAQFKLVANKVQLALETGHTVEIGNAIGSPSGALIYTAGKGDTSSTINMDLANQSETVLFRFRDDGRFGAGLTSMTAVVDIKGGIATEAQFRLRTGTAQTTTDRLNGSFNWNTTNKLLNFYRTDDDAPSVIQMATTPKTSTPSGTTQTIDWRDGSYQILDLGSASGDVTLTFINPVAGKSYTLDIIQGATPRDVIFPSTVLIPGGSAPLTLDITITDNAVDSIDMIFDGTNFNGQVSENYG